MIAKQIAASNGPKDKASSTERQVRLEEALRENLKRRKQQAREKKKPSRD